MSNDINSSLETDGQDVSGIDNTNAEDTVFEPDYGDKEAFLPGKSRKKGLRGLFSRKKRDEIIDDDEVGEVCDIPDTPSYNDETQVAATDDASQPSEEETTEGEIPAEEPVADTPVDKEPSDPEPSDPEPADPEPSDPESAEPEPSDSTAVEPLSDGETADETADEAPSADDETAEEAAADQTVTAEDVTADDSADEEVSSDEYAEDEELDDELGISRGKLSTKIKTYFKEGGHPFEVVLIAVVLLAALSFVPWGDMTNNFIKDFSLVSDLFPEQADSVAETTDMIDPALEAEMQRIALGEGPVTPKMADDTIPAISGQGGPALTENPPLDTLPHRQLGTTGPVVNGEVIIEDYTYDASGMKNLRKALANRKNRAVRIAMIGDSYIEGDIITADLRDMFQSEYGGRGVGYVAAHNIVQGFRQTVKHQDSGWTHKPIAQASATKYFTLAGEYFTGGNGSTLTLTGVDKDPKLQGWNSSRLIFVAPAAGKITLTADGKSHTYDVQPSPGVQSVVLPAETTQIKVQNNVPGLILLGVWLEDANGVVLDNMSIRGDSGISRRSVNVSLASQMRKYVDYDLIIVEYGINALSSKQTDYSTYAKMMTDVLQRLRQSYPNADIIMMGIGDRGQKFHGEPHSFPTAHHMVDAQRQVAKDAGVLFWDTREAMGGDDAIVRWREQGLANADYIHLNFQGGKKLAELLYKSINTALRKK